MERTVWLSRLQVGLRLDAYTTRECREKAIPTWLRGSCRRPSGRTRTKPGRSRGSTTLCPPPRVKSGTRRYGGDNRVRYSIPARLNRDERRIDPHGQGVASFSLFDFSENLQPLRTTTTCNNHHYLSQMDDQRCGGTNGANGAQFAIENCVPGSTCDM